MITPMEEDNDICLTYLVMSNRRKICKIILAQSSEYLIVGSLELDVTVVSLGPRAISTATSSLDCFKRIKSD